MHPYKIYRGFEEQEKLPMLSTVDKNLSQASQSRNIIQYVVRHKSYVQI